MCLKYIFISMLDQSDGSRLCIGLSYLYRQNSTWPWRPSSARRSRQVKDLSAIGSDCLFNDRIVCFKVLTLGGAAHLLFYQYILKKETVLVVKFFLVVIQVKGYACLLFRINILLSITLMHQNAHFHYFHNQFILRQAGTL